MAIAVLFAFISACGFASGTILIRVGLQHVAPPVATFMTVVTGAVLICAIAFAVNFEEIASLNLRDFGVITVMGILAYPMARVFMNSAIAMVGATRAVPVTSTQPLIAFGIGVLLLGESPNLLVTIGTPVIVGGLLLVMLPRTQARTVPAVGGPVRNLGYLLALCGAASFATRDSLSRQFVTDVIPPFVASGFALAIGGAILFAIARRGILSSFRDAPPKYLAICAGAGVLQGIAVAMLFHALSRAPVTIVSPIHASQPIIALALAYIFLRRVEFVDPLLVVGTLLSVGGVVMVILGATL